MKPLRRGDDRTLTISGLRASDGTPATFLAGDVLRWTLKERWSDEDTAAVMSLVSPGDISFVIGGTTATVTIQASDWSGCQVSNQGAVFVADLELTRAGKVTTLWADNVPVNPDVTGADA